MMKTFKIKLMPVPKEGKYVNLGYLLGITIEGDDPCVSEIFAHFDRNGEQVMYNLTKTPFEHDESVIDDLTGWLKAQLVDQYEYGCRPIKLIVEKKNGKLIFDTP